MTLRILISAILLFAALPSFSQDSPAFRRLQHLRHGINTSEWFAQSSDYSPARLRSYTTLDDIDRIARLGFDHIRISVDPAVFCYQYPWTDCPAVQVLDQIVARAVSGNLAVIIDLHPTGDYKHAVATRDDAVERLGQLWTHIAQHFAGSNPDLLFFELMNEPESVDTYRWSGVQQRLIGEIRRVAPNHTIIVEGARYSDIPNLIELPEFADRNLIFNFHYYSPHTFTHQGAGWGAAYWVGIQNLPFPSPAPGTPTSAPSPEANWDLLQYKLNHWDAQRIAAEIAFAADWARQRGVPLTCNEFGTYRAFSKPDDREHWLTAVREAFEKNSIGWTMWDYRGGFGVVEVKNGTVTEDPQVLRALGLSKP